LKSYFEDELIELEDNLQGTIGFETFMTEVAFDNIRTNPLPDYLLE